MKSDKDTWIYKSIHEYSYYITDYVANGSFATLAKNVKYKSSEDFAIVIRLADYNNNYNGNFVYIDENAYNFLSKTKLFGGEIIISNVGINVGTVFKCPFLNKNMTLGPNAITIKTKGIDDFYYYWFKSNDGQQAIQSVVTGSAQPKFNKTSFKKILIPIPPIAIQKNIANFLSNIDKKIEINNKINDNLEQQAQAVYRDIFIEKAKPEWLQGTIGDLGRIVGGSTPSKSKPEYYTDNGIAWITPKDLSTNNRKFISHGENDITETGLKNSSTSIMPAGTVLFSSRAPIGYIAIASGDITTNQGFKSVIPKPEIGTEFIYYFLKNNVSMIESMASGSTFKEISGNTMKNIPTLIPDLNTISYFKNFCMPIFNQQFILENQNVALCSLRDALLPRLMSGELDVSDIDI